MVYNNLTEKQVALDDALGNYQIARLGVAWNDASAEKIAPQLDCLLQDDYGQRHRVTIVTKLQGNQPAGIYKALAISGDIELRHSNETTRVYPLLSVTRIEFMRSQMPGSRIPTQTDGELSPLTDADARRILKK